MIKLIKNYIDRGHNTVWKVISRWAPAGADNNPTSSYAGQIANQTGIGLHTTIEPDKETLRKLIQAIADFENGQKNVISNEMFEAAYLLI